MSTASYDLTQKLIPFLDRHLVLPLLAHLAEGELFPAEQIARAQYELVKETNMLDYAASLFENAYPDDEVPRGKFTSLHLEVFGRMGQLLDHEVTVWANTSRSISCDSSPNVYASIDCNN